jgi:hypothetical protein
LFPVIPTRSFTRRVEPGATQFYSAGKFIVRDGNEEIVRWLRLYALCAV